MANMSFPEQKKRIYWWKQIPSLSKQSAMRQFLDLMGNLFPKWTKYDLTHSLLGGKGLHGSPWSPENKNEPLQSLLHLIPTAWMIPHKLVITILKHMPRWKIRTALLSSRGRRTHGQHSNSSWLNPLLACDLWFLVHFILSLDRFDLCSHQD